MTPFSKIYDLFLVSVKDYKIDKLYEQSVSNNTNAFEKYLEGFLIRAIPEFSNCRTPLDFDASSSDPHFLHELSTKEQVILSDLMLMQWFEKEINDITQFNLHLNNTDFKHYSEAQNLKEKSDRADRIRERVYQAMVDYGYDSADWTSWFGALV